MESDSEDILRGAMIVLSICKFKALIFVPRNPPSFVYVSVCIALAEQWNYGGPTKGILMSHIQPLGYIFIALHLVIVWFDHAI